MRDERPATGATPELSHVYAELDRILAALADTSAWAPSATLCERGDHLRDELGAISSRWDAKLVVALVGPSGAGKSTLTNRIVGQDVSTTGLTRPTTRHIIACARRQADAEWLGSLLGDDAVRILESESMPDGLILLDTPDTNTVPENRALLTSLLVHIDILMPVFSALNPKLADNIAYLAPLVSRLPFEAVAPVLTMVDRVPQAELLSDVVPDWRRALEREWGLAPETPVYLINAAARDQDGGAVDESPLHTVDQFDDLQSALHAVVANDGAASSQRVALAERMLARYERRVIQELDATSQDRHVASQMLDDLVRSMTDSVRRDLARQGRRAPSTLGDALSVAMSSRLWGPVGWGMLLWALGVRLLQALAGMGRGITLNSWRGQVTPSTTAWAERMADRLRRTIARVLADAWPPIGDALARAGFSHWRPQPSLDASQSELAATCQTEANGAIERLARRLTHGLVQLVFNLPLLVLAGWVAWEAVYGLVSHEFLPAGFLDQALVALTVLWAISLALYQAVCSLALLRTVRHRLTGRVASVAANRLVDGHRASLARVDDLGTMLRRN